ncbi:MAG TPA: LacI family DNA-binding transcriptional regulator [Anaerolineae bacterium]|nr:LacI family DNA-binding transcriptional regulator [Anaerolineae bacterium]HQK13815.1 LacI family DNA-binding transcriptional regulator [Anaerolineae bacterium]
MSDPQTKRATLHDVAALAGVSYQTVSRVINNQPYVAEKTRAKVLQAIRQLDYRPNQAAQALATGRSYILQLLMFDIRYSDPFPAMLYWARKMGYTLAISEISPAASKKEVGDFLEDLATRMVDGLIIYTPFPPFSYQEMQQLCRGVPFVLVGAEPGVKAPSVVFDQRHGCRLAVQHLLDLGHRQIAEITGPLAHIDARLRHETLVAILQAQGLTPGPSVEGDFEVPSGYRGAKKLLENGKPFTALFVANDRMALGALCALHEQGLKVPEDVSVIGFDDMGEAAYFTPPLTTVRQDLNALAQQCIEYLVSMIKNPDTPVQQRNLYPELIVRKSTAPVARSRTR